VPDLMDRSRLSSIPGAHFVSNPRELAEVASGEDLVLVDLSRPGILDVVEQIGAGRVVGFASHVDERLMDEARRRGCDEVLARSVFFRRYSRMAAGGGGGPGPS
jgi:hypothetical protein